jgi:hypothetical protein
MANRYNPDAVRKTGYPEPPNAYKGYLSVYQGIGT